MASSEVGAAASDRQRRGHDGCTLPSVRAADAEAPVEAALAPLLAADVGALLLRAERAAAATQSADAVATDRERERLARVVEAEARKLTRQREMLQADLMTEAEYRADRARTLAALQAAEGALTAQLVFQKDANFILGRVSHPMLLPRAYPKASGDAVPPVAEERRVTYLPDQKPDEKTAELLELFSRLDDEGKKDWLSDLRGFVRGRRPHTDGHPATVARKR